MTDVDTTRASGARVFSDDARFENVDWASHPLGPVAGWPAALRIAVRQVLASSESMYLVWGPERYFFFNALYAPILGPRLDVAMGARLEVLWADAWPSVRPHLERAEAGESSRFTDLPVTMNRYGVPEQTWWTFSYSPAFDEQGAVAGVLCITNETTEHVRRKADLHHSEARNRQILDSAIDYAVIATDVDGHVTRWNTGACQVFGWTEEDMLGQTMSRCFTLEDREAGRMEAEMHAARSNGRGTYQRWHLRKEGDKFWASGATMPLRNDDGDLGGYVKVLRNHTRERRQQQRLALLAEVTAGLLDAVDPDSVLGPMLEQSSELLGFEESYSYVLSPDCEHLHLTHSVGATEEIRNTLVHASFDLPICGVVAQTLEPVVIEHLQQTTEPRYEVGRACGYDAFAAFPVLAGGTLYGVMSFASRDRPAFDEEALSFFATLARYSAIVRFRLDTEAKLRELATTLEHRVEERTRERQMLEEQLRQSQKMEAVGQLTGGLAHDFNNLLAGISGSLELSHKRMLQGRGNDIGRYLAAAQDAVKRAAALTHRLLAFSRRQTLAPKTTDIARLIVGMEELIGRTVGPSIRLDIASDAHLWPSLIDPSQLENAILNLCINARDAMPDGGTITIESMNLPLDPERAKAMSVEPGAYLEVCVTDTGTGMTPDVIAKAFDPFFTTKPIGMGTGLGLSMIYGFAKQSGGVVEIRSEAGHGTSVSIYLPRHLADSDGAQASAEADAALGGAGEVVLVVDDEPTVRLLVTEVLGDLGYQAVEAEDGATALKVLESTARIDLLITDVGLPNGINGRQVADAARALRPDLKVLFITGYAESSVLSHGDLAPGMHVMTKPFSIEALTGRIEELLGR